MNKSKLLSFDLVEVKPLPSPIGKLNYIDFVYYDKTYYRFKKIDNIRNKIKKGVN